MTTTQFQPPSPLDPSALIDSADHAVNRAPLPMGPSRETIHRAISTAYYAVFHAITASNADIQHGTPVNPATARTWTHTYRMMGHNRAVRSLNRHLSSLSGNGQALASDFTDLKNARETADYDPNRVLTAGDANHWIGTARNALTYLQALNPAERQTLRNITITGYP